VQKTEFAKLTSEGDNCPKWVADGQLSAFTFWKADPNDNLDERRKDVISMSALGWKNAMLLSSVNRSSSGLCSAFP